MFLLRASTFTHVSPSGHCYLTVRPVHGQVHEGSVSVSAPRQRWGDLEGVFAIAKEARNNPLPLRSAGREAWGLFHACCFPFANFSAKRRRQPGEALSPALLPALSLPAGPSQLQRPCSYCWGKQKTTAMRHQTGLHHVYAMTEVWARLQRGWGSLRQLRQPFHVQGCALEARRAERPLAVIASKSLISSGGPETGSQLANVEQRADVWFGKRGREPGLGKEEGTALRFCPPSSTSLMATQPLAFNLRSLSLDNREGKAGERQPLSWPVGAPFPQLDTLEGTEG